MKTDENFIEYTKNVISKVLWCVRLNHLMTSIDSKCAGRDHVHPRRRKIELTVLVIIVPGAIESVSLGSANETDAVKLNM